jgi:nitric oxide dioxygenase
MQSYVGLAEPSEEDVARGKYDLQGLIELGWLRYALADAGDDADYYFCGPVPFMKAIKLYLAELGISDERAHYEFFGTAGSLEEV